MDGKRRRPYRMSGDGLFINLQMMRPAPASPNRLQTRVQRFSVQNMGIFNYVCSLECQSLKGVVCSVVVAARRSIMQVWYVCNINLQLASHLENRINM